MEQPQGRWLTEKEKKETKKEEDLWAVISVASRWEPRAQHGQCNNPVAWWSPPAAAPNWTYYGEDEGGEAEKRWVRLFISPAISFERQCLRQQSTWKTSLGARGCTEDSIVLLSNQYSTLERARGGTSKGGRFGTPSKDPGWIHLLFYTLV